MTRPPRRDVAPNEPLAFLEGGHYHALRPVTPEESVLLDDMLNLAITFYEFDCPRCGTTRRIAASRLHAGPRGRMLSVDGPVICAADCGWDVEIRAGMVYERHTDPWDTDLKPRRRGRLIEGQGDAVRRRLAAG